VLTARWALVPRLPAGWGLASLAAAVCWGCCPGCLSGALCRDPRTLPNCKDDKLHVWYRPARDPCPQALFA
jgi:hypothetical protein